MFPLPIHRRVRTRRFTLVELLAATALIVVLGGVLVRFYGNMQKAYNSSLRLATLSEEARAVFSILTRDLRLASTGADDLPGYDIRIHQPSDSSLWFVTANESSSGSGSSLLEVGYRLNGTTLERAEVNELDSEWNPYGDRDSADHQYGYQPVVDRVIAFRFICYDDRMVAYVPEQDSSSPAMVGLALTLLDTNSFARWQQLSEPQKSIYASQQARTFRKTVQIPTQQLTQE